jgi:hypothetical protein
MLTPVTSVLVPLERVPRWCANFATRHGETSVAVQSGTLTLEAADGSSATLRLPWGRRHDGAPDPEAFATDAAAPLPWGLLLVRKGGFAVARGLTTAPEQRKVGRRHVQGRSKAGGWSQQRFARRRDQQAREAYAAAAEHAHRILVGDRPVEVLVCGGDRSAVEVVLADRRLSPLAGRRVPPWLAVPDPTPAVLASAVADAWSARAEVTES